MQPCTITIPLHVKVVPPQQNIWEGLDRNVETSCLNFSSPSQLDALPDLSTCRARCVSVCPKGRDLRRVVVEFSFPSYFGVLSFAVFE